MRVLIGSRFLTFVFWLLILLSVSKPGLTSGCQLIPGERLEYQVYAKGLLIGEQTLSIIREISYQDQLILHIQMQLRSYPAYALFFSYRETADLYLDPEHLTPVYLKKKINEKGKTWEEEYLFGEEIVEKRVKVEGRETRLTSYQANNPLVEGLSLIYYLRARPWEKEQFLLYYLTTSGLVPVEYQYKGQEKIKTRFDHMLADVIVDPVSQVSIWFSKDEQVYPLRISISKDFGILTSRLVKVSYAVK
jgi:hypothetical protein